MGFTPAAYLIKLQWIFIIVILNMAASKDEQFKSAKHVALANGNLEFTINLYKKIADADSTTNVFFSPLSITTALAMTTAGARENTARELKETLKLNVFEDEEDIHTTFHEILKSLNPTKESPFTLHTANRMYVQDSYKLVENYLTTLTDRYLTTAVSANFHKEAEKVRSDINGWVEEITRNKIKNLIPEGVLNAMTRLVLINAIYFKGNWKEKFDTRDTIDRQFYRTANDTITVPMMYMKHRFPFAEIEKFQCKILELPYSGDRLVMFVVLPNDIDGIKNLEKNLNTENFKTMRESLHSTKVKVTLPKFKLEFGLPLNDLLKQLGIKELFSIEKANLTGISEAGDLYVSDVIHKAFVEVNEEGTEAAAATAIVMMARCIMIEPEFTADHPFLFLIYDKLTDLVLFMGRLSDPPPSSDTPGKDEL